MRPRIAITASRSDVGKPEARRRYREAITQAGGEPVLIAAPDYLASVPDMLERFDGLLLPGGRDVDPEAYGSRMHPTVDPAPQELDAFELEAARACKRLRIPTLGICRGIQILNVAFGGSLYEDIDAQYAPSNGVRVRHMQTPDHARSEPTHRVEVEAGSQLAALLGATSLDTNSIHHQALRRVAADLAPVAHARDGVIEGVEMREGHPFLVAVQWHPEDLVGRDEPSRSLFRGFVAQAAQHASRRAAQAS